MIFGDFDWFTIVGDGFTLHYEILGWIFGGLLLWMPC